MRTQLLELTVINFAIVSTVGVTVKLCIVAISRLLFDVYYSLCESSFTLIYLVAVFFAGDFGVTCFVKSGVHFSLLWCD